MSLKEQRPFTIDPSSPQCCLTQQQRGKCRRELLCSASNGSQALREAIKRGQKSRHKRFYQSLSLPLLLFHGWMEWMAAREATNKPALQRRARLFISSKCSLKPSIVHKQEAEGVKLGGSDSSEG